MRLRNIPGARERLEESPYVYVETELKKGEWCSSVFKNDAPLHIEIGTGKGRFINQMAKKHPDTDYLGLEKYSSVLVKALNKIEADPVDNLRLVRMDATDLNMCFEEREVDRIYLNFSDPWPKDRHAKRRLTSDRFLSQYEKIMKPGGCIEFKTDNTALFEYSLESVRDKGWKLLYHTFDLYSDEEMCAENVPTEYELKFTAKGNKICKLIASF